jgi:L-lactate dehydrogenase (cytochrome)
MTRKVSTQEVSRHNKRDDTWIVVDGEVYDMTEFAPEHPGGPESEFNLTEQLSIMLLKYC